MVIRHISFRVYMAFVPEVKVYEIIVCLLFEFSVCPPTDFDVKPNDFKRAVRQCMRKA
ncbi:hypothetical protein TFUB22_00689 [Tannerella forsythia]|nr:hypothetical protein TFUB22_00689 [Tannerella forsythia]